MQKGMARSAAPHAPTTSLMLLLCLPCIAGAQAPIRERGEAAAPVDGARRAFDTARDALSIAQTAERNRVQRTEIANRAYGVAKKELDEARAAQKGAATELARAAETDRRAARGCYNVSPRVFHPRRILWVRNAARAIRRYVTGTGAFAQPSGCDNEP